MDFLIRSRRLIESSAPPEVPHVVVSITSSPADVARIPPSPACLGILRLAFADRDFPREGEGPEGLFSREDARRIWDFVLAHREQARCVVLHCKAGVSRSPAVAAALARVLRGDDEEFFRRYGPNARVYRILLDVYEAEYSDRG
ncbi:MAG: hypothetical protein R3B09_21035 [Nannocystaceae bacterium]